MRTCLVLGAGVAVLLQGCGEGSGYTKGTTTTGTTTTSTTSGVATTHTANPDLPTYCPDERDLNVEYGHANFQAGGWQLRGDARVSTKTSWNLLGGFVEFDMDAKDMQPGITGTFYTSSPKVANCGLDCYCDIQGKNHTPVCMEMDFVESNGNCKIATTWHTEANKDGDCDRNGCQALTALPGDKVRIKASFSEDGWMNVTMDGRLIQGYRRGYPKKEERAPDVPTHATARKVKETFQRDGAVLVSSQWKGWAPRGCPGGGKLSLSHFKIANLKVKGHKMRGPTPPRCDELESVLV